MPFSLKRSPSLTNAALTAAGVVATVGQVRVACTCDKRAGEAVDHREEDDVERLLGVRLIEQVVDVRDAELAGEAGVDGAALGAFLVHLLAGVIAEDDVLGLDAEAAK